MLGVKRRFGKAFKSCIGETPVDGTLCGQTRSYLGSAGNFTGTAMGNDCLLLLDEHIIPISIYSDKPKD